MPIPRRAATTTTPWHARWPMANNARGPTRQSRHSPQATHTQPRGAYLRMLMSWPSPLSPLPSPSPHHHRRRRPRRLHGLIGPFAQPPGLSMHTSKYVYVLRLLRLLLPTNQPCKPAGVSSPPSPQRLASNAHVHAQSRRVGLESCGAVVVVSLA